MTTEELKAQGNKAFSAGRFKEAIAFFTQAIEADPTSHVLYSNRSAAYASVKDFDNALEDAQKTVDINPTWAKGYSRLGAAYHGLQDLDKAKQAYTDGLNYEPENALLKKGLEDVERAMVDDKDPFKALLNEGVWAKIASNPKLSPYLADPSYRQTLTTMIQNPKMSMQFMQDQRIMQTLLTLMGINMQTPGEFQDNNPDMSIPTSPKEETRTASPVSQPTTKKGQPKPQPMEVDKSEEDLKMDEALKEKQLGTDAYKKRDFDLAITHYDKAWQLSEHKDVTVLTNKAAVMFELGKLDECIQLCEEAVEVGREHRADYKVIARALGRIGNAYLKKDDLDLAIKYFEKSLTEQRSADILLKLRETEKLKIQRAKDAYKNPQLADEARERGNALFKEHKYADALQEYTESIKRNEMDPRSYSNRSACYHKLTAIPEALKDCEMAIKLDPAFVKAYIRKAAIQFLKKEYTECLETCNKAKEVDADKKHTAEIDAQIQKCYMQMYTSQSAQENMNSEERLKKAMADPEVQAIMADPVMNQILQQMQNDPGAVKEHMKNPVIAAKIRKLIASGVVGTR